MQSSNLPKNDPSVRLLNEIEILLAQSRLLELYFKQAQTAAAYEQARAQERHQAELMALRVALAASEQTLAARQTAAGATEPNLLERVKVLEIELAENRHQLNSREAKFHGAESEAANLRARIGQLEAAMEHAQVSAQESATARHALELELADLRGRFEKDRQAFEHQQLVSREIQGDLQTQLAQLQEHLRENQTQSNVADRELQQARREIEDWCQRATEFQASRQEAEANAARELAHTRAAFAADMGLLQTALSEREHALEENQNATSEIERGLNTEILTLRSQLDQKQELIGFRDDELRDGQSQIVALQQRLGELEAVSQLASTNADELEGVRRAHESEVAALQHEVAVSERALTERQEAVTAVELALHGKIQFLEQELARSRNLIGEHQNDVQSSRVEVETLRQRVSQFESTLAGELAARQIAEGARGSLEDEISSLGTALAQKEQALDEQKQSIASLEERLGAEVNQLPSLLEERRAAADLASAELERLRSALATVGEEKAQLAKSHDALERSHQHEAEIRRELEPRLQAKDDELQQVQANVQELIQAALKEQEGRFRSAEAQLATEIVQLRNQLQEQELATQQARSEDTQLHVQIIDLQEQNAQSENLRHEHELSLQQAGALRQALETRLEENQNELEAVHGRASEQATALLERETYVISVEGQLKSQIHQLESQLEEQRAGSDLIDTELERLRSEAAATEAHKTQLENAREELERSRYHEAEVRRELEARLQAKDDELQRLQANAQELIQAARSEHELQLKMLEEQTASDIVRLKNQLHEQEQAAQQGRAELAQLNAEIARLQELNAQSEQTRNELQQNMQQARTLCREFETRLKAEEDEFRVAQTQASEQLAAALREQETYFKATEVQLNRDISELRTQLEHQKYSAGLAREELSQLRSATADIEQQRAQSENRRHELEKNWQEAAALKPELEARLRAKDDEYQSAQFSANTFKSQLDAKINELQLQLAEKQLLIESKASEINDLKAAADRLTEQLARRDSAAAEFSDRLQREIEASRAEHQAQITALREESQLAQRNLEKELAEERQCIALLRQHVSEFERRNADMKAGLNGRQQDLEAAAVEVAALRSRLEELETRRQADLSNAESENAQARMKFEGELAATHHEVQQKNWAAAQQQANLENLALAHKKQIEKLEEKIAEQQNLAKDRSFELEKSQSQTRLLERRVDELTAELRQGELTSINRAVQIKEEYGLRIAELERQVAQKNSELVERRVFSSELEPTLRLEIDRLIRESQERNKILQDRNDELVRVKADLDNIQEQYRALESAVAQGEAVLTADAERMRTEFQAQLALLQAELSQKEWALDERQAVTHGLEQKYHQEIESLRRKLTETKNIEVKGDFVLGEAKLDQDQETHFEKANGTSSGDQAWSPSNHGRRWHTGFAWKRRWKSSETA